MRSILIAAAAWALPALAGSAHAQTAGPQTQIQSCPVTPCRQGPPPAAAGGEAGSGPAALRGAPQDSPVATGAGGGNSDGGTSKASGATPGGASTK